MQVIEDLWMGVLTFEEAINFGSKGLRISFAFDREFGNHITASFSDTCGTLKDMQDAIKAFAREGAKLMKARDLTPQGPARVCGDQFIWSYDGSTKSEPLSRSTKVRFGVDVHRGAELARQRKNKPKGFLDKVLKR